MGVDPFLFRQVMGRLATGVAAVTTTIPGGFHGLTANSFAGVSVDPPLVLVCIDRLARARDHIRASRLYAVNILSERQQFLADRLAGRGPGLSRHFEGVPYTTAATGAPILWGCLAWLDCAVQATHEAGDHTVFVGRVLAADEDQSLRPLLFDRGAYAHLAP